MATKTIEEARREAAEKAKTTKANEEKAADVSGAVSDNEAKQEQTNEAVDAGLAKQGNEPPKNTAINTPSLKQVAPGSVAKTDPDNREGDEKQPPRGVETANVSETAVLVDSDVAAAKLEAKDEMQREVNEMQTDDADGDGVPEPLSVEEQRKIDAMMGDTAEIDPGIAAEEKASALGHPANPAIHERLYAFQDSYKSAQEVITGIVAGVPDDTPDEFSVWGAGGFTLRLGHLRALVAGAASGRR
jgi:hypothetical protein